MKKTVSLGIIACAAIIAWILPADAGGGRPTMNQNPQTFRPDGGNFHQGGGGIIYNNSQPGGFRSGNNGHGRRNGGGGGYDIEWDHPYLPTESVPDQPAAPPEEYSALAANAAGQVFGAGGAGEGEIAAAKAMAQCRASGNARSCKVQYVKTAYTVVVAYCAKNNHRDFVLSVGQEIDAAFQNVYREAYSLKRNGARLYGEESCTIRASLHENKLIKY